MTLRGTRRQLLWLCLVALVATACGSTAQPTGDSLAGSPGSDGVVASDGLSVDGGAAPADSGGAAGGVATDLSGVGSSSARGTSSTGATGSGPVGSTGGAAPGTTGVAAAGTIFGIENGFIKVGIARVSNQGAAYEAIGASGLAGSGHDERMIETLVNEINLTGIKGLKIKLVRYDVDANDASTPAEVHQQRQCAAYTQDDRVYAAMAGEGEVLDACLAKAGVVQICGSCSISTYDDQKMAAIPLLFSPNGVTVNRQVDFYVKGLVEAGFFTGAPGPPKVGFITYDDPVRKRQFPRLEAELKRRTGLSFAKTGFLPKPGGGEGDARFLSAIQNFMLQFKAAGVNRVLMLDNFGQAAGYGMQAADKNAYYPRWGFNSTSGPGILLNQGLIPPGELPGMTVVGWMPSVDIGLTKDDTQWPPGLKACVDRFTEAGMTMASDTDYGLAGIYCDRFLFLRDALNAAPGLSPQQFGLGAAALGSSFRTSIVYGADQSRGRRDGGENYRVAAYHAPCNCFRYTGPLRPMS